LTLPILLQAHSLVQASATSSRTPSVSSESSIIDLEQECDPSDLSDNELGGVQMAVEATENVTDTNQQLTSRGNVDADLSRRSEMSLD
jgi:hypothetical protein